MEFEITDIDLGRTGEVIHYRDDIALIDADTIIYGSAVTLEEQHELLSKDFYTDTEWAEILNDKTYDKETHSTYSLDLEQAYKHSSDKIQGILDATGCKEYELHFTGGRGFCYDVNPTYKSNRTGRIITGLRDLKYLFVERHSNAYMNTKWEADHIVVCKKRDNPSKYLLCAVDKDVLYSLPGHHFNYYSSTKYNIAMKFIDVDEERAFKHHYKQVLTGDAGDGVIGLKGIGTKRADIILQKCTTKQECWDAVVKAYDDIGILKNGDSATVVDAIVNMRLVNMQQLELNEHNEYEVKLWSPF